MKRAKEVGSKLESAGRRQRNKGTRARARPRRDEAHRQISRYGFSEPRTTPCLASNAHDDDNDDGLATLNAH
jgi:hypothetical protein